MRGQGHIGQGQKRVGRIGWLLGLGIEASSQNALLLERLGLDPAEWPQDDRDQWPSLKRRLADLIKGDTLAAWCELLEGTDTCFAPVLPFSEARSHPHLAEREATIEGWLPGLSDHDIGRYVALIRRMAGEPTRNVSVDIEMEKRTTFGAPLSLYFAALKSTS